MDASYYSLSQRSFLDNIIFLNSVAGLIAVSLFSSPGGGGEQRTIGFAI
jgi:hypothetical protein